MIGKKNEKNGDRSDILLRDAPYHPNHFVEFSALHHSKGHNRQVVFPQDDEFRGAGRSGGEDSGLTLAQLSQLGGLGGRTSEENNSRIIYLSLFCSVMWFRPKVLLHTEKNSVENRIAGDEVFDLFQIMAGR